MAGIIKSGQFQEGPGAAQLASFNFEDMSHKADTYLEAIRRQAAQILAQAKEQAGHAEAQIRERVWQSAVNEAEQQSQAKLEQQLQTLLPALGKAVESIGHARELWLKHWERNTVSLAAAIAARIIRREVSRKPEISLDWVREALELVTGEGRVSLHLNPHDFEVLGERAKLLTERLSQLGSAQIVSDSTVELAGCRVNTEFGSVDQQVSAQLRRIEEELTD